MSISITEIRITLRDDEKLKAFVSITLENCFVIRGMKIIKGSQGMFVAMPSRRKPDGGYQDLCHPINRETRRWMEEQILQKYHEEAEKSAVVR
jgi:stage V sporulation protein G